MNLWEQILARVEAKVNRHSFYTWFKPTSFIGVDDEAMTVRVPNVLFKDWLTKHYSGVISEAMMEVRKGHLAVNYVAESVSDASAISLSAEEAAAIEAGATAVAVVPAVLTSGSAGLNLRYTFDTFIVGSSNQFAHAACRAVAEAPSRSYNP